MSYPWDFEAKIDAEDILDYVRDNQEWFLDKLEQSDGYYKNGLMEFKIHLNNLLDNYNTIRLRRDHIIPVTNLNNQAISLYEDIEELIKDIDIYLK